MKQTSCFTLSSHCVVSWVIRSLEFGMKQINDWIPKWKCFCRFLCSTCLNLQQIFVISVSNCHRNLQSFSPLLPGPASHQLLTLNIYSSYFTCSSRTVYQFNSLRVEEIKVWPLISSCFCEFSVSDSSTSFQSLLFSLCSE